MIKSKYLAPILSTSLAISILSISGTYAHAEETPSNTNITYNDNKSNSNSEKGKLKAYKELSKVERKEKIQKLNYKKGAVTEEQINSLDDKTLANLDPEGEIVSISTTDSNLDSGDPNKLQLFTMPKSDFSLKTVAQRITGKGKGYDCFQFTTTGVWGVNPFYEFTDTIGLAWSDNFTLYHDESLHYTSKKGRNYYWEGTRNKVSAEKGVAHDVDLKTGYSDNQTVLLAYVYKKNSKGTANVVGEYGHVELSARDISVGFSSSPDISFSIGAGAKVNAASPSYDKFTY